MMRRLIIGFLLTAVVGTSRADPAATATIAREHDHVARMATVAWWLGVQAYPHELLDRFDPARALTLRSVWLQTLAAIETALDTSGPDDVYVAFNPCSFRAPRIVHRHTEPVAAAAPRTVVVGPGDRLTAVTVAIDDEATGTGHLAFAVDPPPIGAEVYRLRTATEADPPSASPTRDLRFATEDSVVRAARQEAAASGLIALRPVDAPSAGPWGRSLSFLQLGTDQGPGHGQVDVTGLYKRPGHDHVVVRLINRSAEPADGLIVATLAPIRAWQELGPDDAQIVAGADVDLLGGALTCDLAAGAVRAFALELAPPPPYRRLATPLE